MITTTSENIVERSGNFKENNFRIKASKKSFQILSSGLYSNKIQAITREISCNAFDSHVAAGCPDKPFDVHLPTRFEPFFSIRDYGTGLSKKDVEQIYTTYFESTKTNSNDFIGCLGLGSKSPFSYTDSFTVTSFFNGKKFLYSAFINEDGIPAVALMNEADTNEPNGLEVNFAVAFDFDSFINEAKNIYQYFKVKPNFIGLDPKVPSFDYRLQGSNWAVLSHTWESESMSRAIMGNVAYPFTGFPSSDYGYMDVLSIGIHIRFDVGALDVAASRESLSFDPATIAAVKSAVDNVKNEFADKIKERVDAANSLYEANQVLKSLIVGNAPYLLRGKVFHWRGQTLGVQSPLPVDCTSFYNTFKRSSVLVSIKETTATGYVPVGRDVKFILLPAKEKNVTSRIRSAIRDGQTWYVAYYESEKERDQIIATITRGDIFPESIVVSRKSDVDNLLPAFVRTVVARQPRKETTTVKRFIPRRNTDSWVDHEIDFSLGGVYLPVYRGSSNDFANFEIDGLLQDLKQIGHSNVNFVGVLESKRERFDKSPLWTNLKDYCKDAFTEFFKTNPLYKNIEVGTFYRHLKLIQDKSICLDGKFVTEMTMLDAEMSKDSASKLCSLSAIRRLVGDVTPVDHPAESLMAAMKTKYEMILHHPHYHIETPAGTAMMARYINAVNK